MCSALTDNRNRTAGELRKAFEVCGGNLGATGCVGYMFTFKGLFLVEAKFVAEEALMEIALEAGADDISPRRRLLRDHLRRQGFDAVKKALDAAKVPVESAETTYIPSTWVDLDPDNAKRMARLRDILDENEDVQNVYANDNLPDGMNRDLPPRRDAKARGSELPLQARFSFLRPPRTGTHDDPVREVRPPPEAPAVPVRRDRQEEEGRDRRRQGRDQPGRRRPRQAHAPADHREPPEERREPRVPPVRARPGRGRIEAVDRLVLQAAIRLDLDPNGEILPLIGSKEGLGPLPVRRLNPGDVALVPDPCYPVYKSSTQFAGGEVHLMPLSSASGFRPDFSAIPADVWKQARLMFLNYPNNPTGATVDLAFYGQVLDLAEDTTSSSPRTPPTTRCTSRRPRRRMLQLPGAKDHVVEFHSLSKTFNMTGWRVGFAAGGSAMVGALGQVKSNTDSGIFTAIQFAAKTALDEYEAITPPLRPCTRSVATPSCPHSRDRLERPLARRHVLHVDPCPSGYSSTETCAKLLDEAAVVTTPGVGFGKSAEGFIRATLTVDTPRLVEAVERIGKLKC